MNNELKQILEFLREDIKQTELRILDYTNNIKKQKQEIDNYFKSKMVKITNEIDDKGKPIFSNQDKRNAEINIRLNDDKYYNDKLIDLENKEYEMKVLIIELQDKKYAFRIFEILSRQE
jgi:hypothetical protein